MNDLRLTILNGGSCSSSHKGFYERAYSHWKDVWRTTFSELNGTETLVSDNFTRQTEVVGLFNGVECIALVCHRYADTSVTSTLDDSYFSQWPDHTKLFLKNYGKVVAIGNQISIIPAYRGTWPNLSIKEAILWLSLRRLSDTTDGMVLGTVREDKSMDRLFLKFGAKLITSGITLHNVKVSLEYFDKLNLKDSEYSAVLEPIFQSRNEDPILQKILAVNKDGKDKIAA